MRGPHHGSRGERDRARESALARNPQRPTPNSQKLEPKLGIGSWELGVDVDIRVLGIGNVLMGDDGFGPYVVEALGARYEFPDNVSVIDVGTPGLDLAPFLIGADAIIVIDTVRSDGEAG